MKMIWSVCSEISYAIVIVRVLKTNIIISQSQIRLFSTNQHHPDNNLSQQAKAMHSNIQQLHTEVGKGNAQQPTITGTLLQNQAPETYIQQKLIISQSQRQPYIYYSRVRKLPFHFTFHFHFSFLILYSYSYSLNNLSICLADDTLFITFLIMTISSILSFTSMSHCEQKPS